MGGQLRHKAVIQVNRKKIMKKSSISDYIQIAITILIAGTLILTLINVVNQNNFNKNTLRPWILPEMSGQLIIGKTNVEKTIFLSNPGYSPAIDVYMYSLLNNSKEFPIDTIKYKIRGFEKFKKAIIFPNQKKRKYTMPTRFTIQDNNLPENNSMNQIRDFLLKDEVYLHLYVIYMSPDKQKYYLKETFRMKYVKNIENGIFVDWIYIWSSIEKL